MPIERLLTLLRSLSAEDFVSGTELARRLGLSRGSVHLALQHAADLGVDTESIPGRGYRLRESVSWLDADTIRAGAGPSWDIEVLTRIDSTNAELLRRPSAPRPLCLATELQTAGRGRRGRSWVGAVGGSLLFSVAWSFGVDISRLSGLSLAVGLAVAEGLDACGVPRVQLKWPNDVIVDFRKLAGVLIEVQAEVNSDCRAIIGIGLNVRLPAAVRDDIDQAVVDLAQLQAPLDRNLLLAALLRALQHWLPLFEREGFDACRGAWEQRHAYQGQNVCVTGADGRSTQGKVLGLGAEGQLLLMTAEGVQPLHVGELSLRRGAT